VATGAQDMLAEAPADPRKHLTHGVAPLLGLPRIKQLAALHGGSLSAASRAAGGTTVALTLPAYDATLHTSRAESLEQRARGGQGPGVNFAWDNRATRSRRVPRCPRVPAACTCCHVAPWAQSKYGPVPSSHAQTT
jgi:hypothetical protein